MNIITRYLLREFVRPFIILLLSFDTMYLIFDLFDNMSKFIETGFPTLRILQYYGSLIASYSHLFAPAALMLATLFSMWMLSRNSEITAMRASGISFLSLSMPFLGVAAVVALLQWANSEYVVPEAASWAARMKNQGFALDRIDTDPHDKFQFVSTLNRRQWFFQSIDTANVRSASSMTGEVSVVQENAAGDPEWKIVGLQGADYIDGEWWFRQPQVRRFDIDGGELPSAEGFLGMPQTLRMSSLTESPRDIVLFTRDWENYSVGDMRHTMEATGIESASRHFDLCYRFAAPLACVVITLFAVPAGLTTARQSILKGIFTALGAFFGFYAMTHFCNFLGQGGHLPALAAAWLPNLVFLTIGIVNYRKLT